MQNEIDHQLRKERGHTSSTSSGRQSLERYTGIVEDRTEDELHRASRQALQDALRREWTDREKVCAATCSIGVAVCRERPPDDALTTT